MVDFEDNPGRYVSMSWRYMNAHMAKKLEPLQIGVGQYPFLFSLYIKDGQSQQSLSERLLLDKAATVRAINKLEDAGYVKRIQDPSDKRAFQIQLTDKGKKIRPQLEKIVADIQDILLGKMEPAERSLFLPLLAKMAKNIASMKSNVLEGEY